MSGDQWLSPFGLPRVGYYGMFARRHMHEYGTTSSSPAWPSTPAGTPCSTPTR
ncbi:MAG: hypothetical protein U0531_13845 [Dehalococcoidia bacterium]